MKVALFWAFQIMPARRNCFYPSLKFNEGVAQTLRCHESLLDTGQKNSLCCAASNLAKNRKKIQDIERLIGETTSTAHKLLPSEHNKCKIEKIIYIQYQRFCVYAKNLKIHAIIRNNYNYSSFAFRMEFFLKGNFSNLRLFMS